MDNCDNTSDETFYMANKKKKNSKCCCVPNECQCRQPLLSDYDGADDTTKANQRVCSKKYCGCGLKLDDNKSKRLPSKDDESILVSTASSTLSYSNSSDDDEVGTDKKVIEILIEGMTCSGCTDTVSNIIQNTKGVESVEVDLDSGIATIIGAPDTSELIENLNEVSYNAKVISSSIQIPSTKIITELIVEGMTCSGCEDTVSNALRNVKGIMDPIKADANSGIVQFSGNPDIDECIKELDNLGYKAKFSKTLPFKSSQLNTKTKTEDKAKAKPKPKYKPKVEHVTSNKDYTVVSLEKADKDKYTNGEFSISGMKCSSCVGDLEGFISKLSGVASVQVNLLAKRGTLLYNPELTTPSTIADELTNYGYPSFYIEQSKPGLVCLAVKDLSLDSASEFESALSKLNGVQDVQTRKCTQHEENHVIASVQYIPTEIKARDIISHLHEKNYTVSIHDDQKSNVEALKQKKEIRHYRNLLIISIIISIPAFILSMILMWVPSAQMALDKEIVPGLTIMGLSMWILATPIQFYVGKGFYVGSWHSMKRLRPTMDVLICLGTSTAYFASAISIIGSMINSAFKWPLFFETSIFVIAFVILGKFLENRAKSRTSSALQKLFGLQASSATLLKYNKEKKVIGEEVIDINLIELGDHLKIVPGEKIPCDGKVIFGQSSVNESLITGESMPVKKTIGSDVIGGAINQHGVLHIEATRVGAETALSQIIKMVDDAQTSKGNIQKLADKISSVFVPVVLAIAILTFIIWISLTETDTYVFQPSGGNMNMNMNTNTNMNMNMSMNMNMNMNSNLSMTTNTSAATSPVNDFVYSIEFGITVLVIACPCALGLATPTAVMVGTGLAAKHHILIKGGDVLERSFKISNILFDKTGTLTMGLPQVTHFQFTETFKEKESQFWSLVASAESSSEHPLGRCIADHAKAQPNVQISSPKAFKAISGMGIKCKVDGVRVLVGNRKLMKKFGLTVTKKIDKVMTKHESEGKTAMLIALGENLSCLIVVSDPVREEAKAVLKLLCDKGITLSIISGDNKKTVNAIAKELGIDRVFAEVLPGEKKAKVEELQSEGFTVAMVGDGINDSPALAQADVGIAIGTGTDIAIESAGIVLMRSNLNDIVTAIEIAQRTYSRIRVNFVWAFIYNCIGIPIAAGVFYPLVHVALPPWGAGLAMALSSVSVLVSSLLLKRFKPTQTAQTMFEDELVESGSESEQM